jgi:hypothetical protein
VAPAGAARSEDDGEARLDLEGSVGEIASVPPAEVYVREQYVDWLLREDAFGLLGAGRDQDREPCIFQSFGGNRANHQVIFDNENARAACIRKLTFGLRPSAPSE